jgi:signal transduction histidine kinase
VAGRTGRLLAFFMRTEPRGAPASGWALALDAAGAVGAAIGAVYEMASRTIYETAARAIILPGSASGSLGGPFIVPVRKVGDLVLANPLVVHASFGALAAAAMTALPLAARRVFPVGVWLTIAAAIVAVHPTYVPPVALGTAVYAAYSAITHSRHRNLAIAVVAVATLVVAGTLGNELPKIPGRLTAIVAILTAGAAGLGIRVLRRRLADSTARLRRAGTEAAAATERALAAERARIASELHDVVTHNVSVMIVQAGAARKIMASSPPDAEDALLAVEATGREAMTELRNLLGLLSPAADDPEADASCAARAHSPGGVPPGAHSPGVPSPGTRSAPAVLRPQPGLGELDTLIGRVRAAGLPVALTVTGAARALPPGADLAAYRVVQEGLTNVLRHAGQATASVTVRWDERLEITVSDDGRGSGQASPDDTRVRGPGRGILGLGERLALYGGELTAGAQPDGGWRIRAALPLTGLVTPGLVTPGLAG